MKIETIEKNGKTVAMVRGENSEKVITDVQSALDFMVSVD